MNKLTTTFLVLFSITALMIFQSCGGAETPTEDPCEGMTIGEGCSCDNGVIDCPSEPLTCEDVTCPSGYTCEDGHCISADGQSIIKSGMLSASQRWTADKIWILKGYVVVDKDVTLTIEPGTIIKGEEGASALVVARGGQLNACANAEKPIIMTSVLDNIQIGQKAGTNLTEADAGKWGGLIVLGNAPISAEGDSEVSKVEGIPVFEPYGLYGGADAADNSGCIQYVSIRHGGAEIDAANEVNGITLAGVGSGTKVNHIEIVGNLDDGIECFGGTVNIDNVVIWAPGDDAFDIEQGYAGTISNFVYVAGEESDHGLEIDGPMGSNRGAFTMKSGTMKGLKAEYADFRKGALANISGVYWFGFDATDSGYELELDDDATSANYQNGSLVLKGMEFNTYLTADKLFDDKAANGNDVGFETKMAADNAIVTEKSGAVGADVSIFGWTYSSMKEALKF